MVAAAAGAGGLHRNRAKQQRTTLRLPASQIEKHLQLREAGDQQSAGPGNGRKKDPEVWRPKRKELYS